MYMKSLVTRQSFPGPVKYLVMLILALLHTELCCNNPFWHVSTLDNTTCLTTPGYHIQELNSIFSLFYTPKKLSSLCNINLHDFKAFSQQSHATES